MNYLKKASWSPFVAGVLIGIVSWFSVLTAGKYLGVSTSFVRSVGMIEKVFFPEHGASLPYFLKEKPIIDWQWMEVLGILLGAFIAAKLSGDFKSRFVPPAWEQRFGPSRVKRWGMAFLGGAILMFGARMADGWTSGHGVSGSLQLALSGWISLLCFFIGGIFMARLLYGKGRE